MSVAVPSHSGIEEQAEERSAMDVLLFQINHETYAIPSTSVREVVRHHPSVPVPGAPPTLPGILNRRGLILPVVELRLLLGLNPSEVTRATRFVIVAHNDIDMALLVDAVLDLISLPTSAIESVPAALDVTRARFLRSIAQYEDQAIALLDLDEVIAGLRDWS